MKSMMRNKMIAMNKMIANRKTLTSKDLKIKDCLIRVEAINRMMIQKMKSTMNPSKN